MGSTKTYVGTSAMHLVDAGVNPFKDAVLYSIFKEKPLATVIRGSLLDGMGSKMRRVHNYAKTSYALGLPEGNSLSTSLIHDEDFAPYILSDTGYPHAIVVLKHLALPFTPGVAIYEYLLNTRGYTPETNQISLWPNDLTFAAIPNHNVNTLPRKVEIRDVRLSGDGLSALVEYALFVERISVVYGSMGDIYFSTVWREESATYIETVPIPNVGSLPGWNGDCLAVVYKRFDAGGVLLPAQHVWVYHLSSNLHPALNPVVDPVVDEYLPVIPLRYNNVDLTDAATQNTPPDPTNLYSTSKALLKKLSIDFEDMGQRLNANPDIAEIDHAYIMWGVDLQTNFAPALYYLTLFFDQLYLRQTVDEFGFLSAIANPAISVATGNSYTFNRFGAIGVSPAATIFTEHGLGLDMRYAYIKSSLSPGTIGTGKVGYAEKLIESYPLQVTYSTYSGDAEGVETVTETHWKLTLKAQISPDQVRVIEVHDPEVINRVYGRYVVITTLDDVFNNPDDHSMIFPLQYNLTETLTISQRSVLYADSTLLVINSIKRVKLKWYQKSWFKAVVMFVAFVITVSTGQAWVAAAVATLKAGFIVFLTMLLKSLLISFAIGMAAKWIIDTFGAKIGIIGAIIAAVAAIVYSRDPTAVMSILGASMPTAQLVLQGSMALISSAKEFLVEEAKNIYDEFAAFKNELAGLWAELEKVQDLLERKTDLDPLAFTRPNRYAIVPNETPDQFFTRCLDLVDNTYYTIHDNISSFVDNKLKLTKNMPYGVL